MTTPSILQGIAISIILLTLTFGGCGGTPSDPGGSGEGAPLVPPVSTLQIDFDAFSGDPPAGKGPRDPKQSKTFDNWAFAAANLVVWNTLLGVTLAVPVAAFAESFNHQPQPQGTEWVWRYEVTVDGVLHTAALHGALSESNVNWRMLISKEDVYTDFEWFSGVSNATATSGTWTLNRDPMDPSPFLDITWQRSTQDDAVQVQYTNIAPGAEAKGSTIIYGITPQTLPDAFYEITGADPERTVRIEWTRADTSGRVRSAPHFNDDDWHCWNDRLRDTPCTDP